MDEMNKEKLSAEMREEDVRIEEEVTMKSNLDEDYEENQVFMTPGQMVMRRFFRNKLAVVGIAALLLMALFCFAGPLFYPYSETEIFYKSEAVNEETGDYDYFRRVQTVNENGITMNIYINLNTGEYISEELSKSIIVDVRAVPSSSHILGTNEMGQDMFARLMYGGRISLMVGFIVVIVEIVIGTLMGGLAGYYGGKIDMLIMRIVEIFQSIPFIPLMLIVSSFLVSMRVSPSSKIYYTMLIMGLIFWAGFARMIRGSLLQIREMEYMQAAEATGIRPMRKILKHMIPNVMPIIIVMSTMDLGAIILMESTMSFLGIGVGAPYASWGNMVSAVNSTIVMRSCPYLWIPPGVCILITVVAFNFVGDGLRDAFDPKMKR